MRFLFAILLLSFNLISQTEIKLDNNLTGILSSNNVTTFGFNYVGNNSIDFKKISYDFSTNYATRFSPSLKENEFIQRQNIGYEKERWDLFVTHQYNYSLIRKISSDNWIGVGGGLKFKYSWGKLSFSYATIYQNSHYFIQSNESIFRHSLRTKIKLEKKNISFSSEYFFQPNFSNFRDVIIYGTSKISLSTGKSVSFIIQDVVNFRSTSDVKAIHNLSIGVGYKFNKKIDTKKNSLL
jgi:hypothetical protein